MMKISDLKTEKPFKGLFLMDGNHLVAIQRDMETNGYDPSQMITIWQGKNIVVDGHTRLIAARQAGIIDVPVYEHPFEDENEAIAYAIHRQRDRRNLSDVHILHLVEKLDQLLPRGGDRKSNFGNPKIEQPNEIPTNKEAREAFKEELLKSARDSRDRTAELIGISTDKVSQCRHVLSNCQRSEINQIISGTESLYQVYKGSLLAKQNAKKKQEQHEKNRQAVAKLRLRDFPEGKGFENNVKKLDHMVLKLLPKLYRHEPEMYELMTTVKHFKSQGEKVFKTFCAQEPVQQFLGHLFTTDFIATLQDFGYKIEKPADLKVIWKKRIPKVDRRKGKMPVWNITRVHEPGFVSKRQRKEWGDSFAQMAERDLKQDKD